MTKSDFLIQAVLSLNNGKSGNGVEGRPDDALKQYERLVELGVKFDEDKPVSPDL